MTQRAGDGVSRVLRPGEGPGAPPPPPVDLPEGREPGDARGATWRPLILGGSVVLGLVLAAVILAAAWLEVNGRSPRAFITELSGPLVTLAGLLVAAVLARVANSAGRTLRNQKIIADNQVASSQRVDVVARAVAGVIERTDRLDARLDDLAAAADGAQSTAVATELAAMRATLQEATARIGRLGVTITGSQSAVPPPAPDHAPEPLPPPPIEPHPAAPSAMWTPPTRARTTQTDPETGSVPTFEEIRRGLPEAYRPRRDRPDR